MRDRACPSSMDVLTKRIRADTSSSRWTLQSPRVLRELLVQKKKTGIQ